MDSSSRGWWIGFGALVGALVALAVLMVPPLMPNLDLRTVAPWRFVSYRLGSPVLIGAGLGGLVVGGFLGSRARRAVRVMRASFGAFCGAVVGATIGGFIRLYVEVTGGDWPHGSAAFATGATVGGLLGLVAGGFLGMREGSPLADGARVESRGGSAAGSTRSAERP